VVVSDEEEEDCGVVTSPPIPLPVEWEGFELPSVLETPDDDEIERAQRLRSEKEPNAIKKAYQKVRHHELDIKLVRARYYHRSNKMKFHFSAENRVDFRELVRDLASLFHARIEMRQIGVRDSAAMIGGYGACGEELCCTRFLQGFDPITIRMAKDQNLALNPGKISGCCGRLLCCLKYEHDTYAEAKKVFPKNGTMTRYGELEAKVSGINILKRTVNLATEGHVIEVPLDDFKKAHEDWRNAGRPGRIRKTSGREETQPANGSGVATETATAPDSGEQKKTQEVAEATGGEGKRRRRRRRSRKKTDR